MHSISLIPAFFTCLAHAHPRTGSAKDNLLRLSFYFTCTTTGLSFQVLAA